MAIKFLGVEVPSGFEERGSTTSNGKYQYYTAEEVAELGNTYIEIELSSADILDSHNTSIPVLPSPGAGNYYNIKDLIVEYNYNTAAYETDLGEDTNFLLSSASKHAVTFNAELFQNTISDNYKPNNYDASLENEDLVFTNLGDPINSGDGTALIKIWYSVESVGSNL
jgi:hypothetical protein